MNDTFPFLSSDQSSAEEQKRDRKGGKGRRSGSESESEEESESESSESESESEEESESDADTKKKKKVWECTYFSHTTHKQKGLSICFSKGSCNCCMCPVVSCAGLHLLSYMLLIYIFMYFQFLIYTSTIF